MDPLKQHIYNALARVEEPDLKKDLVTLGMVKDITVEGLRATVQIELTTPACPLKEVIRSRCVEAIEDEMAQAGIAGLELTIDLTADVTAGRQDRGPILPGVRNIIAIASGKGGVGKSTVTCNLAYALAQSGARVGLIDADISGPSIPTMFGAEGEYPGLKTVDGKNYIVPIEKYGVKLLSIGFLAPTQEAVVWRGPMMSSALRQFIQDTDWGDLDYLLFDMPPGTSDIHLTLVQTVPLTGALVVTTPQKVALADARKAVSMFGLPAIKVPVLGIVENMSWFTPAELPDSRYYLFGQGGGRTLATEFDIPMLGQIPLVQSIREAADDGLPIVSRQDDASANSFQQLAQALAQQVSVQNAKRATPEMAEA